MSRREEIEILETLEAIAVGQSILLESINANLARLVAVLVPFATTATLSIQGDPAMPDLTLTFVDDTGAPASPPKGDGSGLTVTGASDGTTSVGAFAPGTDPNTYVAPLTVVDDGTVSNLTAVVANTSGAALVDDDGTTSFVQPPAFAFTAPAPPPPAQAVTATLSVA